MNNRGDKPLGLSILSALLLVAALSAQEATITLPGAYKVQFENEWVRVTRVRYGPMEKLPAHSHTSLPSAYVYLNDAGPVIFGHVGGSAAKRPATKAGAFRVYRGLEETHEVQNTTETPSEFLRVEFKTEPKEQAAFRGKFERAPVPGAETTEQVQFDHAQARISRIRIAPGSTLSIAAAEGDPSLLIALLPGKLRIVGADPLKPSASIAIGQAHWLPDAPHNGIQNEGSSAAELLRFQFRTKPAA